MHPSLVPHARIADVTLASGAGTRGCARLTAATAAAVVRIPQQYSRCIPILLSGRAEPSGPGLLDQRAPRSGRYTMLQAHAIRKPLTVTSEISDHTGCKEK